MLPTEISSAARVHSKYWTEDWANHAASCDIEDLLAANNGCVARALSMGAADEDLVRRLRKKNEDLEKRVEASSNWEAEVEKAKKEVEEVDEKWILTFSKLDSVEYEANHLKHEFHESVSQVVALTKKVDQANDYQKLTSEALEEANKERVELRKLTEGQADEINSLKAEAKTIGEVAIQNYKDNFENTPEYDEFANYWTSWAAKEMMSLLRERHPDLDINFLEEEFGGPTGGRPSRTKRPI